MELLYNSQLGIANLNRSQTLGGLSNFLTQDCLNLQQAGGSSVTVLNLVLPILTGHKQMGTILQIST